MTVVANNLCRKTAAARVRLRVFPVHAMKVYEGEEV